VDTYLFALYDEDLKPGPGSERSFGLFKTDLTMVYDIGLSTSSQVRTKFTCISLIWHLNFYVFGWEHGFG
jgi:hypothetical protein